MSPFLRFGNAPANVCGPFTKGDTNVSEVSLETETNEGKAVCHTVMPSRSMGFFMTSIDISSIVFSPVKTKSAGRSAVVVIPEVGYFSDSKLFSFSPSRCWSVCSPSVTRTFSFNVS